jgi:hypothetical protein
VKYSKGLIITLIVFGPVFYFLSFPQGASAYYYSDVPQETYAYYLDAGTGSIILQAVIGGLVGGLFAIKMFWHQIKGFFRKLFSKDAEHEE